MENWGTFKYLTCLLEKWNAAVEVDGSLSVQIFCVEEKYPGVFSGLVQMDEYNNGAFFLPHYFITPPSDVKRNSILHKAR